jgi:hypothetical protein
MKHRPVANLVVSLVLGAQFLAACVVYDEPHPPSQDTGASDPDCNQAFQDALDAGLCQPPAKLVINFDLGSTEYIYVDDPYFEAVGAVGVFGPGIAAGGGGAVGGIADSVAHVIESNGSCEILCAYDIVTCNDDAPICLSLVSGCLYCNDDDVTIEQCEAFLSACTPEQSTGASGEPGASDHGADSTT